VIDLNVQILTTGFWPTSVVTNCTLPSDVLSCCDVFKRYYLANHSSRRITWQTNMGTAELRGTFGAKKHELSVSTYQMCVLLHFNNTHELSFKDLLEITYIPALDLKRNLSSLSVGKYKILNKSGEDQQVTENDSFSFNPKFRSKLYRVKIMAVAKESEPERLETRLKVDEDRKHQIEAAIVRIMKSRRTLEHSLLIAEVTKLLSTRFLPNPQIVKKRIESLIERDYLERSKQDRKVYQYMA